MLNVEGRVGGECRMLSRRDRASGGHGRVKGPDEVGQVAREHRPDELGKTPVKLSKRFRIRHETAQNFR
jgi:hypothetical protein